MGSTPCAPKSGTFWPRSLRCRGGEPDSPVFRFMKSMREIVLDTETTGLDPLRGDRLVEVGGIEIYNSMSTGQTFHRYINPERDLPAEAFAVRGLSSEFLSSKPLFTEVVEEFLEFIGDAPLVIHNASFAVSNGFGETPRRQRDVPLTPRITETDREVHRAFIATLGDNPIWNDFLQAAV